LKEKPTRKARVTLLSLSKNKVKVKNKVGSPPLLYITGGTTGNRGTTGHGLVKDLKLKSNFSSTYDKFLMTRRFWERQTAH
jgi:hypothetical protein